MESRFAAGVIEGTKRRGHDLQLYGDFDLFFGGLQIIVADPIRRTMFGNADPRRGGTAIGY